MTTFPASQVRLDDLIHSVATGAEEPLDQLAQAVLVAEHLGELADALVGHFVEEARRSGSSWSEIGRSLGVSKQAAQKRFVSGTGPKAAALDASQGFSRFTEDGRAVVVAAHQQAHEAGSDRITVAHLVLALVADADSPAARAISAQGVSLDDVRRIGSATLPPAAETVPAMVPFDAHARSILEQSFAEAQRAGSESVDSQHVLLALLAAEDGTGVLAGLGVTP